MKSIEDRVFGIMIYKHAWKKEGMMSLWGEQYPIWIVAQAYGGEEIVESQRDQYQKYPSILRETQEQIKDKIKAYIQEFYGQNTDVKSDVTPTSVVFCRNGNWGVLFETKYDVENGLAVFFDNQQIKIGTQDDFF